MPRLRLSNGVDYPLAGRLNFVDNQVDPSTGTIAVRAEFAESGQAAGPRAVRHRRCSKRRRQASALLIPQAAVQEDQGGRFVLVVGAEDKVEVRRIETGARLGVPLGGHRPGSTKASG